MYSRLDPIFKTQMRRTETLDTRQGIRRHEQTGERDKRDDGQKGDNSGPDLWEDQTSVSVRALKAFLEQLIGEARAESPSAGGEDITVSTAAQDRAAAETPSMQSQNATKAAQAYQRTYRATHEDDAAQTVMGAAAPSIELRPEEIRVIHQLIADLGRLSAQKVEYLTLFKSESFLQSLVDAVNKA